MPRFYCDYCDTYLTHDSPSVRKQHNSGYKHKANVRSYYQKFEELQTQTLIDQKIKEHASMYQQIGAAYNHHLAAFPGQRPHLPMMPHPQLPVATRPPMLPLPVPGPSGYGTAPMVAPVSGHLPTALFLPMQPNVLPNPPAVNSPVPVPGRMAPPNSHDFSPTVTQATYQGNSIESASSAG